MRTIRPIAVCFVVASFVAACSSSSSAGSTSTSASGSQGPDQKIEVTASVGATTSGFRETTLEAKADRGMEITFINDDVGIPHNIQIFAGTSTIGTPLWAPANNEMITGVATTVYEVPGLPAGVYAFNCFAHPATMVGTLTVT